MSSSKLSDTQLNSTTGIANLFSKDHPDARVKQLARGYIILLSALNLAQKALEEMLHNEGKDKKQEK